MIDVIIVLTGVLVLIVFNIYLYTENKRVKNINKRLINNLTVNGITKKDIN